VKRDAAALIAFIDSRQNTPHHWGRYENDCVAFVLKAVKALTGHVPSGIGRWNSRRSGFRLLKKYGSLEAALDAHFERIAPAFAKRGDIAGVPDEQFGIHPMIVEGDLLVGPGERGNRRMKRSAMTVAWSATDQKAAK
jgi:hypothetical protein